MICHQCKEPIEQGEACKIEPTDRPGHYHFYHCGCHTTDRDNRQLDLNLQRQADLARTVH